MLNCTQNTEQRKMLNCTRYIACGAWRWSKQSFHAACSSVIHLNHEHARALQACDARYDNWVDGLR
jgi:hypothetical protein